jgi:hypothetical protein
MSTPLERRLLPFIACQGAFATLIGFAEVLVFAQRGWSEAVQFTAVMLTVAMVGIVGSFALGRRWSLRPAHLIRAGFLAPAFLLLGADGEPLWLALAVGLYLGLTWGARHWLELSLLADADRDAYAAHTTVWTVFAGLSATLTVTLFLSMTGERAAAVYTSYAVLALVAAIWVPRQLPDTPAMHWDRPWAVVRQPGFSRCLPLYGLESGLLGIGMVLGASGAVQALGVVSHYGWTASAATVLGGLALFALRRRRHAGNRLRWMAWAALGMVAAHLLLGASVWHPALYVVHLLTLAAVQPFWAASEQVLNQRVLDLEGALADRIVVREFVLWAFRMLALGGFWWAVQGWSPVRVLLLGAGLMAVAVLAEWGVGRAWLTRAG